jgi:beta-lactamase class A
MLHSLVVTTVLSLQSVLSPLFAELAKPAGGRVGVYATVIGSDDRAELNGAERFPMQSVYKVPIAMAVLDQVDHKTLTLNQKISLTAKDMVPVGAHSPIRDRYPRGGIDVSIRELIRAAIADSDGTASDVLLRVAGGPPRVTAYLRGLGIRDMAVAASEADMTRDFLVQYKNYSTPQAAVELLKALSTGRTLTAESRQLLLDDMIASTPGPKRLKGLLPQGTVVAHKTGTDATREGVTRATNDVGLIALPDGRQLAIAVFVKDSSADEATREGTIAKIARAAWDRWEGR